MSRRKRKKKLTPEQEWRQISANPNLTLNQIREYQNYLDWGIISKEQKLPEEFIENFLIKFIGDISPDIKSYQKNLSENFLVK